MRKLMGNGWGGESRRDCGRDKVAFGWSPARGSLKATDRYCGRDKVAFGWRLGAQHVEA
jgi:hypothetical protein